MKDHRGMTPLPRTYKECIADSDFSRMEQPGREYAGGGMPRIH